MKRTQVLKGVAVILVMGLACAKQGFPPGGPEDRTPPEVVSVYPADGATDVDRGTRVSIGFSEWMDKRSVSESIFLSPVPKRTPRINIGSKNVDIEFPGGLNPRQTYVITVGTGAKDAHGNRLESSLSLAFSTGNRIDTGQISGQVYWPGQDVTGAYAWSFRTDSLPEPDPANDAPDYITQTDGSGSYAFTYLPSGVYRVFAFQDRDGNGIYTVDKDPLGVPLGDVELGPEGNAVFSWDLFLAQQDTIQPACLSVTSVDNRHTDLRMSEAMKPQSIAALRLFLKAEMAEEDIPLAVRYLDPADGSICHLVTPALKPDAQYEVHLAGVTDEAGNPVTAESAVMSFQGSSVPDTIRPGIVSTSPPDSTAAVPLDHSVEFVFTEAMDTGRVEDVVSVAGETGDAVAGTVLWPEPSILRFVPAGQWAGATTFSVSMNREDLRDVAGNEVRDSLTAVSFTTIDPALLGHLSGAVGETPAGIEGDIYVLAEQVDDRRIGATVVLPRAGEFMLEGLPPGTYHVWTFRDEDGDGAFTPGRPKPIRFSEPFAWYPDSVEIRPRWETQGIDIVLPTRSNGTD